MEYIYFKIDFIKPVILKNFKFFDEFMLDLDFEIKDNNFKFYSYTLKSFKGIFIIKKILWKKLFKKNNTLNYLGKWMFEYSNSSRPETFSFKDKLTNLNWLKKFSDENKKKLKDLKNLKYKINKYIIKKKSDFIKLNENNEIENYYKNVFIRFFTKSVDKISIDNVYNLFSYYGNIKNIFFINSSKDYFIYFEYVQTSLEFWDLNNLKIHGEKLKISLTNIILEQLNEFKEDFQNNFQIWEYDLNYYHKWKSFNIKKKKILFYNNNNITIKKLWSVIKINLKIDYIKKLDNDEILLKFNIFEDLVLFLWYYNNYFFDRKYKLIF